MLGQLGAVLPYRLLRRKILYQMDGGWDQRFFWKIRGPLGSHPFGIIRIREIRGEPEKRGRRALQMNRSIEIVNAKRSLVWRRGVGRLQTANQPRDKITQKRQLFSFVLLCFRKW